MEDMANETQYKLHLLMDHTCCPLIFEFLTVKDIQALRLTSRASNQASLVELKKRYLEKCTIIQFKYSSDIDERINFLGRHGFLGSVEEMSLQHIDRFSGGGLRVLKNLPKLNTISILGVSSTNQDYLEYVCALRRLKNLTFGISKPSLDFTLKSDISCLFSLNRQYKLESLTLYNIFLKENDCIDIGKMDSIRSLKLYNCSGSHFSHIFIGLRERLHSLELFSLSFDEDLFWDLSYIRTLKNLQIDSVTNTVELHPLTCLDQLESLTILGIDIKEGFLKDAGQSFQSLHTLELGNCEHIRGEDMRHISSMKLLQKLSLNNFTHLSRVGILHLCRSTSLMRLEIRLCQKLSCSDVEELRHSNSLRQVWIERCYKISEKPAGLCGIDLHIVNPYPSML